jgi:hypothetical protein
MFLSAAGSSGGFGAAAAPGAFGPVGFPGTKGFFVGSTIDATPLRDSQSETEIAVDPSNPNRVMQQANDNSAQGISVQSYSDNSFKTFRQGTTIDIGDPTVTYDKFGNLWRASLDTTSGGTIPNGIDVAASSDNGRTFFFSAFLENPFDDPDDGRNPVDQPRIRFGPSGIPGVGGAVWVEFTALNVDITPQTLVPVAFGISDFGFGSAALTNVEVVGPPGTNLTGLAIGPNGEATFAYQDAATGNILVSTDLDGLGPNTPSIATVATHSNIPEAGLAIPAQATRKITCVPRLAYDTSPGPHNGRLYLAYTDVVVGTTQTNVFVRFSDNFGGSWSPPVKVNDFTTSSDAFFDNIAVDQTTGNVMVVWYDTRKDTGADGTPNDDVQVWGALSTNSGLSFTANQQISPGTSNGPSIVRPPTEPGNGLNQFGDYLGLAFDAGKAWVSYTDNSSALINNPDRPLPDIAVTSVLVNRGSGVTAIGDRFQDGGGNNSSSTAAPLILNPTFTEVDGMRIFPKTPTGTLAPEWFKFRVPTTGILTLNMDITPAWPTEGQMGMRLYRQNAFGQLLQIGISENQGSAAPQQIFVPVTAGQVLLLYCHGIPGNGIGGNGAYNLRFNIA